MKTVYVCPKCHDINYSDVVQYEGQQCECCDSQYIDTHRTTSEWSERLREIKHKRPKDQIGIQEWDDFVIEDFFGSNNTPDEAAIQARLDAEEKQREQWQRERNMRPHCPKCQSVNIGKGQRGFKWGRAIGAAAVTGFLDVGAIAGAAGSNKIVNVCNNCGHKWG